MYRNLIEDLRLTMSEDSHVYADELMDKAADAIERLLKDMRSNKKYSEDIIAEAVRKFWHENRISEDVVVFFWQKYETDDEWEWCEELVETRGFTNFEDMTFLSDFCEGQTMVKGIKVVPLEEVTRFYARHKLQEDCE